jgi:hypothetical protein
LNVPRGGRASLSLETNRCSGAGGGPRTARATGTVRMKKPIALLVMVFGLMFSGLMVADFGSTFAAERGGGGRGAGPSGGSRGGPPPSARWGGHPRGGPSHWHGSSRGWHGSHTRWSVGVNIGGPVWGRPWGPWWDPWWGPWGATWVGGPWVGSTWAGPWGPWGGPAWVPPTVVVPSEPRFFVERDDRASDSGQNSPWWFYCRESDTFYPYVRECAGEWERVPAQPQ